MLEFKSKLHQMRAISFSNVSKHGRSRAMRSPLAQLPIEKICECVVVQTKRWSEMMTIVMITIWCLVYICWLS